MSQIASLMLAPLPNTGYMINGHLYTSDAFNLIHAIQDVDDQIDLIAAGCAVLAPVPQNLLFILSAANFNSTADQQFTPYFIGKYRITKITAQNTSVNAMPTAVGGIYTGASKTGTTIVANTQVYTGMTNSLIALDLTLAVPDAIQASGTSLYFSLTTPKGGAATADLYVWGDTYP